MAEPWLSYLICSTPRSGSTLLCEVLANTGIAGRPEEYYQQRKKTGLPRRPREYFEDAETDEIVEILGDQTRVDDEPGLFNSRRFDQYSDYLAWTIQQGSTPNGVFGAKVMWGYFNGFISGLQELPGKANMPRVELLPSVFPNLRYVSVTRADKIRQAVSLWKALQTWTWRRDATEGQVVHHDLRYSFDALDHLVRSLESEEAAWIDYFVESGVQPYVVEYERFAQDNETVVFEIIDFLGIDRRSLRFQPPAMTRQADALSEEWIDRYSSETQARAVEPRR